MIFSWICDVHLNMLPLIAFYGKIYITQLDDKWRVEQYGSNLG